MLTNEFDFKYPTDQVAYRPSNRGESKLMIVSKSGQFPENFPLQVDSNGFAYGTVSDLVNILQPEDLMVINDTKVISSRLQGIYDDGSPFILMATKSIMIEDREVWECVIHPSDKAHKDTKLNFKAGLVGIIRDTIENNEKQVVFNISGSEFLNILEIIGEIPLPLYLGRGPDKEDNERYQSVFAINAGSVASPTASLHFSTDLITTISNKCDITRLTLHIGTGTFRTVTAENTENHIMHSERFNLPESSAKLINSCKDRAGRVFAIGTTSARTLESCFLNGKVSANSGETNLFITPGYNWNVVDCLLTNFHFPKSTLFMLVCSLLGTEKAKQAYSEAFNKGFKLFSYGDAMLII